jgi:hypothetical protein
MARLEIDWNIVSGFNRRDVAGVFCDDDEAVVFQMFDPVAAASSAR